MENKSIIPKKKNKTVKDIMAVKPVRFDKFDPDTGEKVAEKDNEKNKMLAGMEMSADARKTQSAASSKEKTVQDAATGGSLSFLTANSLVNKDSKMIKGLTAGRKKGLVGLIGAGVAGSMSLRKQKGEYNKQQGARENLAGKDTGRAKAYKGMLKNKYKINDN